MNGTLILAIVCLVEAVIILVAIGRLREEFKQERERNTRHRVRCEQWHVYQDASRLAAEPRAKFDLRQRADDLDVFRETL